MATFRPARRVEDRESPCLEEESLALIHRIHEIQHWPLMSEWSAIPRTPLSPSNDRRSPIANDRCRQEEIVQRDNAIASWLYDGRTV